MSYGQYVYIFRHTRYDDDYDDDDANDDGGGSDTVHEI